MHSPTFNLTFIHIPKTGGSSITTQFSEPKRYMRYNIGHLTMQEILKGKTVEDWGSVKDVHSNITNRVVNSYRFSIVRNPYDRIRSFYSFVMKQEREQWGLKKDFSFHDFINCRNDTSISWELRLARAWWPQAKYITDFDKVQFMNNQELMDIPWKNIGLVDKYIKFENLGTELPEFYKKIGFDYGDKLFHKLKSDSKQIKFTPAIKQRIYKMYEVDFKLFGYPK